MSNELTRLAAAARTVKQSVPKLDAIIDRLLTARNKQLAKLNAAIDRLAAERLAASDLSEQLLQRVADERARLEEEQNQAAEHVAELERLSAEAERERAERERAERERAERERQATGPLAVFVGEHLHEAPGHLILFAEFYERFQAWLPPEHRDEWTQIKTTRGLPLKFQTGRGNASKVFLINCDWEPCNAASMAYFVTEGGRIRRGLPS